MAIALLRPVSAGWPITQNFGENPALYPTTKGHNGIDYGIPDGTPVMAAADGQVLRAEKDPETVRDPHSGYGNNVRIQHADGSMTIYGHLMDGGFKCKTGDMVRMGDVIALSDNTGRSTGSHLHFELRSGPSILTAIDPAPFIIDSPAGLEPLFTGKVTPAGDLLRMRAGPSTSTSILGSLHAGDVVNVLDIAGDVVWFKCEKDGQLFYSAGRMNGEDYIERAQE
jgi:hypothetical protein